MKQIHRDSSSQLYIGTSPDGKNQWLQPMEFNPDNWGEIVKSLNPSGIGLPISSHKLAVSRLGLSCGQELDWVRVVRLSPESWIHVKRSVMSLERLSFGEKNVFDESRMEKIFTDPDGINLLLEKEGKLIGFLYGGPIEKHHFLDLEQISQDPNHGESNTFYGAGGAIDPQSRGKGLFTLLLEQQLRLVNESVGPGGRRYKYFSARTEVGSPTMSIFEKKGANVRTIPGGYKKTGDDMAYISYKL